MVMQAKQVVADNAINNYCQARLLAVTAPHDGDWLRARPTTAYG
jgi:hypothetical protein